jgi:hypothetical protein
MFSAMGMRKNINPGEDTQKEVNISASEMHDCAAVLLASTLYVFVFLSYLVTIH